MEKVTIEDVNSRMGPAAVKRRLTDALGATDMALNYYELAPGDSLGFGYHRHSAQEEVFYVQSGTVTFETDAGDVAVAAGEVIRFGPGESQLGTNEGDERAIVLAMGAPQESGELHMVRECAACGERTEQDIELTEDRDAIVTLCVDCGAETGRFD
ncbi:cupin domain-containing protein [Haloarchaeobius sp. HME9146]|uniref:cupin domain-containing protein n=1 Tax=Haloarchaeobius sp. HME9146 TaxID=2978732 RepID=UPI0021BE7542|nr:cupin domain-containing protein [Haloarchaeobius sp. HME9146]MCT9095014.1 cupin domain-containing protein [Haloarchaeobius sp. HME9146]